MCPDLFKIGPFTVHGYGLMLGIAFIVASYILSKELVRKKMDPNLATEITLFAIIFGIAGAKLFYLFENWDAFLRNPIDMIFSAGGLTFYGGLIVVILALFIYIRRKKIPFLVIADITAPSLAIAYGIGRIGCHLAGDGDYGLPTNLPWGFNYEHGTVPPSVMFINTNVAKNYPNGIVPDNTPLHPAPLYEFLAAVVIFSILWKLRKKNWIDGKLFMFYLILAAIERFSIEFIRLNPALLFGLSEAQIISIVLFVAGISGLFYFYKNPQLIENKYVPPVLVNTEPKEKGKQNK
jgi:phosphatidylglycerol---prolipoprotein diacylglyceryl transferase